MRPFLVALALALTTACTAAAGAPSDSPGYVAGDGGVDLVHADERVAAPDVSGPTVDGDALRLADLRGPVVVNFWASWCGPCAQEAPHLQDVAEAYAGRVHVVGVNVKDSVAAARSFERDFGVTYPSWQDPASTIAAAFGGIGPAALPSTLVLDADHRVAVRLFGAVDRARLSVHLDAVLSEAGS